MERHTNKKLFAGFLALSAGLVLASCDPVSAIPTNYNNPVLTSKEGKLDIDENKMGEIYDAVATEKNSKVVEKLLREVAESKFGTFEEFKEARDNASKVEAFTKKYSKYFGTGSTATRRFEQFKQDVKDRINEFFYNEISNSSYEDELGKFSEEKFYNAKRYDLYDLDKDPDTFKSFFVDSTIDKTNAYDVLVDGSDLLKAQYEKTTARGYVKEKVYPDILKDKLVEDYVYRQNYNTLGRSYGREVNMIKLSYEGKDPFVRRLVEAFATKYIEQTKSTDESWTYKVDYTYLVNAFKGFVPSEVSTKLIAPLGAKEEALLLGIVTETPIHVDSSDTNYVYNNITLVPEGDYYVETKLGALLKKYKDAIAGEKAGRFPNDDQKSALETFTSDGKSKEHGLFNEIVKLMKEDYTTDGWHVKASGLSDLPSALKDRLFNIRVANTLDKEGAVFEEEYSTTPEENTIGKWMYVDGDEDKGVLTRLPYIRNINGRKVVIPAKPSYKDREQNYVYEDVSGKSVTICQVLEAPSTSKLNKDQTTEYSAAKKELLARSIAKVLGTKDSYIKDAYTEYLNKYDFSFYDSSLYDYLKSEYPDLDIFDED